jgi:hypothetical protein
MLNKNMADISLSSTYDRNSPQSDRRSEVMSYAPSLDYTRQTPSHYYNGNITQDVQKNRP